MSLHATVATVVALAGPDVIALASSSTLPLADPGPAASSHPRVALADPGIGTPADPNGKVTPRQTSDDCVTDACIDQYLWSVYQRAPKFDTTKVEERRKVTVKKKGKTRTVTKTFTKLVDEDFTWKDPKAADKAGMPLMQYVIGGMDRGFKVKLYHALRALDDAGLEPGITSGFRDNYRQLIASGHKASIDSSYHGGSKRGGYGHGLAADLVSVRGETRSERWASSDALWKWIDVHGKEFGIGRPYLDRDPPHVGPIDGREYVEKRGINIQRAGLDAKHRPRAAAHSGRRVAKRARTAKA